MGYGAVLKCGKLVFFPNVRKQGVGNAEETLGA